ncbi:hypothetical protein EDB81DRAFT_508218 [Dactylonectria macrodidyma]|uniref:Uncharacterized protein n=1 Tax=Dactylonectria macrodidyma TaxID=307937 RepID=A0A9P9J0S3_9HYPO|nr:hypothetical protein EDB81DRAFT_508218 [Dactylonectria macrodidyma]
MGAFISWLKTNLPSADDSSGSGEARNNPPQSLSGMISTLIPILIVSAVYLVIFLLIRRSQTRFYAPRTYLGSLRENERSPELPTGLFNWIGTFWKIPDVYALQHQSLDAYLFIRYLRIVCGVCFVSLCITWPILFPINATGGGGQEQLEILSYSNINIQTQKNRLYAHAFVAWIVYGFVMYTILRECIFYINVRQAFLLSPNYAKRMSSRTVLFTSVPDAYLDEARIRNLFNDSVKNVWLVADTTDLEKLVEERDKTAMKLEKGEIKLLKLVNKERINAIKKGGQDEKGPVNADPEAGSVAARWIPDKKRPSHRLGPLGLIGKKVDTIEWGREELHKLIPQVETAQAEFISGATKKAPAVFVEFHSQSDAQAAFQTVTHHQSLRMSPRYIGVKPNEVVWKSLFIPWWQLFVRRYIVYAFIAAMIIFWAIPVGIVGIIAQVSTLQKIPGLTWIADIPSFILGVISGLLPSVALAILMSLVPVIMRICAKKAGAVSLSQAELFTQNAYFVFQVVQVFLIRTITDTAAGAITGIIQDPNSVFDILSSSLPTSSNFYISYFIVQGLTIATSVLTQVIGCVIFGILYKFLASTPRAMYTKWTTLSSLSWGSLLPVYTNIAVISITYSVIAPLMLFWSTIGMALFYLAFRYNILFVTDTVIDTNGLIYPRALKQLFVGIYLAELCMVGLFVVSKAGGPAALMVVFLIFTVLFQLTITKALDPLLYSLPRSLEVEEEAIQSGQQVVNGEGTTNPSAPKKTNFIMKYLKPWMYADYQTLRQLVPQDDSADLDRQYTHDVVASAYLHPAATSPVPVLWIPEDPAGVSKQEVALTSKVIPITDEGCSLDDKNKIIWDTTGARPPIWSEKIYY